LTGTELTGLEGKRSKLETETSTSTRSSSHDQNERATNKRLSSVQPDNSGHVRSEASPPMGPVRLPTGPSFPSKPTSPISHPLSTINSPGMGDHYSPISASPRSAMFDASSINPPRDPRTLPDVPFSYHPSYAYPPLQPSVTTPPSYPAVSQYHNPLDQQSRRPMRDATRLPPLSHEDTTYSSESGHSASGYNSAATGFPGGLLPLDATKTMRILPQPIPTIGPSASPLDRPHHAVAAQSPQAPDYRTQGPLAALVRAGQLAAKIVDDEAMDAESSP
jgi:hypothetical protein